MYIYFQISVHISVNITLKFYQKSSGFDISLNFFVIRNFRGSSAERGYMYQRKVGNT